MTRRPLKPNSVTHRRERADCRHRLVEVDGGQAGDAVGIRLGGGRLLRR
jgi:hypothetical protein